MTRRRLAVVLLAFAGSVGLRAQRPKPPDSIVVLTSGAFAAAQLQLVPQFRSRVRVKTIDAPSMGSGPDTIPNRLRRGEPADVVIMSSGGLDDLIKQGYVRGDHNRVELARSAIGVAVRAGAPKPDISSADALKRALLQAKSIAISSSISGAYISGELVKRLGIADQVAGKIRTIERERVGAVVARGDAEIGFQQVSELLPVPGIDFLGPLPADVQRVTVLSAGMGAHPRNPDGAIAYLKFLASPSAAAIINKSGLEAISR